MASGGAKGVLALVGGGEFLPGCDFDAELLKASGAKEVLILPTAAAFESPERVVENAVAYFKHLGAIATGVDLLKRRDAFRQSTVDLLAHSTFTYLAGGSPLHLRSVLKQTPSLVALAEGYGNGGVLAASSAGGMVLTDPMSDPRGGALTVGLGLVRNVAFVPHFDTFPESREKRTISLATGSVLVLGVDEGTAAIRYPDGTWSAQGKGSVKVYSEGRSVPLEALASADRIDLTCASGQHAKE